MNSIAIVDYGMGNIWSIESALKYLGFEAKAINNPKDLIYFNYCILPGVGAYNHAMEKLVSQGFVEPIKEFVLNKENRILGICLGMHILGTLGKENGLTSGLGLITGTVDEFKFLDSNPLEIPHVGFNSVTLNPNSKLLRGFDVTPFFYFDHSFIFKDCSADVLCFSSYGFNFVSIFENENVFGVQFHPEKSQKFGLKLLNNFVNYEI